MSLLLETLISASERAANVARACCKGAAKDGALLVAEKLGGDANPRFHQDFKTIADVLAQEAAKSEIICRIPQLSDHIRGEECVEINGVQIGLKPTIEQTYQVLCSLVPEVSAQSLASAAHFVNPDLYIVPGELPDVDASEIGVWIDPIDSTSEFISGARGEAKDGCGLQCVTVLIGAYLLKTGEPIAGVINQPFYDDGKGRIIWGLIYNGVQIHSDNIPSKKHSNVALMSSAEEPKVFDKFVQKGRHVLSVPGAGNKLMKVALDEASLYIVSKPTTFKWDTCAPHAILKAIGGDILNYTTKQPIVYNDEFNLDTQSYSNSGGIIAYASVVALNEALDIIQ